MGEGAGTTSIRKTYVVVSEKMLSELSHYTFPTGLCTEGQRWRSFRVLFLGVFYSIAIVGGSGTLWKALDEYPSPFDACARG